MGEHICIFLYLKLLPTFCIFFCPVFPNLGNRETHKALIKNKILLQWEKCLFENVHNTFYEETIVEVLRKLDTVYDPRSTFTQKTYFW